MKAYHTHCVNSLFLMSAEKSDQTHSHLVLFAIFSVAARKEVQLNRSQVIICSGYPIILLIYHVV